ncbi:MAG: alpha/beta hydrolase [Symplocastrum torsivum CPER-KK1]|jgi:pimeloyl-ACP methyl ester carboxylesterase|uniref:Alpha/beta hydrolase n=1 Tax=Symplocastrum torsivum CPER-KK1 TaxID=450513 RepID=A0A951PQT7_9CYAN|nr:alpha/beta hydrolase [Symplocastrum torsivum CPER-KK1]
MFPDFLPSSVTQLKDSTCITVAQSLLRQSIATPILGQPVATSYIQQGSGGTPILLLHGFDSSLLEFFRLIPLLAAHNEMWAVDLLGFGFTERVTGTPFSPLAIKKHLNSFWKTLINQPVILVGASMGGATAIDFTLTYPNCVKQLVLINSVGFSGSFPIGQFLFPPFDTLAMEWWRFLKLQTLANAKVERNRDAAYVDGVLCTTLPLEMPGWYESILTFTKTGGYSLTESQIAQIDKPTLILWGELDNFLGKGDGERFNKAIANSILHKLKGCGHAPQFEQPEIIAKYILAFGCSTESSHSP